MTEPLITQAQAFYSALSQNNTRDWWQENRAAYDDVLKPAALALLDQLAPDVAKLSGFEVKTKLFRPHRDVRFSKDKTPYQEHLHMMWMPQTPGAQSPVYFFGIGIDYVTAGGGIMGFDKDVMMNWRTFVDLDQKRVGGILHDLQEHRFGLREPALKRVPSPFAADHPMGDLLRMKGAVATKDIGNTTSIDHALLTAFTELAPFNALLEQIAEA